MTYCNLEEASAKVRDPLFTSLDEISPELYEVIMKKKTITHKLPIQIGFFIFNYAKLRMLLFVYEFVQFYFHDRDYALVYSDTDSISWMLSSPHLEDAIISSKRNHYFRNVHK